MTVVAAFTVMGALKPWASICSRAVSIAGRAISRPPGRHSRYHIVVIGIRVTQFLLAPCRRGTARVNVSGADAAGAAGPRCRGDVDRVYDLGMENKRKAPRLARGPGLCGHPLRPGPLPDPRPSRRRRPGAGAYAGASPPRTSSPPGPTSKASLPPHPTGTSSARPPPRAAQSKGAAGSTPGHSRAEPGEPQWLRGDVGWTGFTRPAWLGGRGGARGPIRGGARRDPAATSKASPRSRSRGCSVRSWRRGDRTRSPRARRCA